MTKLIWCRWQIRAPQYPPSLLAATHTATQTAKHTAKHTATLTALHTDTCAGISTIPTSRMCRAMGLWPCFRSVSVCLFGMSLPLGFGQMVRLFVGVCVWGGVVGLSITGVLCCPLSIPWPQYSLRFNLSPSFLEGKHSRIAAERKRAGSTRKNGK